MIKFKDSLFLTNKTSKNVEKIKSDLVNGRFFTRACLITLALNEEDVFDIIPIINLKLKSHEFLDFTVIGLAENKREGIRLCAKLSTLYLESATDMSMREYFTNYYGELVNPNVEIEYEECESQDVDR